MRFLVLPVICTVAWLLNKVKPVNTADTDEERRYIIQNCEFYGNGPLRQPLTTGNWNEHDIAGPYVIYNPYASK